MALVKITDQHGFDAAGNREVELHSEYESAWRKRQQTLKDMRIQINNLIDEVRDLKDNPPSGGSSFLQPPASS
jgi:hypothetical protein